MSDDRNFFLVADGEERGGGSGGGGGGVHGQRRAEKSRFSKERAPMSCSNVGHQPPATSDAPG